MHKSIKIQREEELASSSNHRTWSLSVGQHVKSEVVVWLRQRSKTKARLQLCSQIRSLDPWLNALTQTGLQPPPAVTDKEAFEQRCRMSMFTPESGDVVQRKRKIDKTSIVDHTLSIVGCPRQTRVAPPRSASTLTYPIRATRCRTYSEAWPIPKGNMTLLFGLMPATLGGSWRADEPVGIRTDRAIRKREPAVSIISEWFSLLH